MHASLLGLGLVACQLQGKQQWQRQQQQLGVVQMQMLAAWAASVEHQQRSL
jgi:hypothetical protein